MVLSIDACPAEGPDYPFGWNFEPKRIDFVLRHGAFCLHWRWAQYCGRDRQHDCRRNDDAIADFSVHIAFHRNDLSGQMFSTGFISRAAITYVPTRRVPAAIAMNGDTII